MPAAADKVERVSLPKWFWGLIVSVFLVLFGGTGTAAMWVANTMVDHESRLSVTEEKSRDKQSTLERLEGKIDRLYELILQQAQQDK